MKTISTELTINNDLFDEHIDTVKNTLYENCVKLINSNDEIEVIKQDFSARLSPELIGRNERIISLTLTYKIMNTKEKLMQLLELCIEKGLDFESSRNTVSASRWVGDDAWMLRERVWLSEDTELNNKMLSELITKVKNYQP